MNIFYNLLKFKIFFDNFEKNFLGFGGTNASIDIKIEGLENRKHTTIREKNCDPKKLPVYIGDDDISGTIDVKLSKGKKLEHLGIRVELIGHIGKFRG